LYNSLQNQTALVIGGTRGIGRSISTRLASEGVNLIINYHKSDDLANQTVIECEKYGVNVKLIKADIDMPDDLKNIIDEIISLEKLDILILNAAKGLERPRQAIEQKIGHLRSTLDTNVLGPWEIIKSSSTVMKKSGGGTIIGLLTPGSHYYIDGYSAVAVSKAAFETLIKYTAVELASENIQVNGVMSGLVEGTIGSKSFENFLDKIAKITPSGRNIKTEDVSNLVAWLCSNESKMIVGQTINIDGGFTLASWKNFQD
jgi:enoyl-[acyl-carrier protein] reductase III